MRQNEKIPPHKNKYLYIAIITFVLFYLIYQFTKSYTNSLFYTRKDRINIVVYGPYTAVYSFGIADKEDYLIPFMWNFKIDVPGGYGQYRVGSIGKLAKLDKNYALYKQSFSLASSSFVDYYFSVDNNDIYYDIPLPNKEELKLNGNTILFAKSNANFFDRLYIAGLVASRERENFKVVNDILSFDQEEFTKNSLGLFFQRKFRDENKNVQLLYNANYNLAERLSALIEGNGIRVNDINKSEKALEKCRIVENDTGQESSATARQLSSFFGCKISKERIGGVYDIIFELGDVEEKWEI